MSRIIIAAIALASFASVAAAQRLPVLLTVDITDPTNVIISATGEAPAFDDSSLFMSSGVSLLGLFEGMGFEILVPATIAGNLAPAGNAVGYNRFDNTFENLTPNDLNIFADGVGGQQLFDINEPAFSGATSPFDFSGAVFPPVGTSGRIVNGINPQSSTLGSWQIVPAPGSIALAAPLACLALRRRR
ncbi:MAG: hypothetical protein EA380_10610 [Phycisphaeraceae bacterium]|nr:MAG: hypothetical protein EA380_10610 [Phycisphaeraceae bacterium]